MGKVKITLEDLFNLESAVIYNPDGFKSLSKVFIDSRKVEKNSLFIAIKGEKFDGHNFVEEAIKKGAKAILINKRKLKSFSKLTLPIVTVNDTTIAYAQLANLWRKKLNAKVISITGSNGKTTTKEILAVLLAEKFNVVKTEANNNNHIGVPLTIFSANEKTEILILEQGTNHFGEIEYTSKISEPDFGLITNIGDSHLEFLIDRNGVYREKSSLLNYTDKNNGFVFINVDDPILNEHKNDFNKVITFGFDADSNYKGEIVEITDEAKTKIKISFKEKSFETELPIVGESNAKNFLAAFAIAKTIGVSDKQIQKGVEKLKPSKGRLDVIKTPKAILIDDTYNSNPASVDAALKVLRSIKTYENKIAILGDIYELGSQAKKIHKELSKFFYENENIIVLTIGDMMKHLNNELKKKKIKTIHFNQRSELNLYLQFEEVENSVILIKGSRGMKMEEFLTTLKTRLQ
ncbi:MAG: UDP-N-acetylmuramoyl-tripeptide--D-alanyl-D-alanine ligase [Melioribacteraceae bacterium]|nr:UDP-N-acetylmuramoyl-tripeptide--D-alanyl-D-alanine ligase [Melioribacteraceae bacterium]